MQETADLVTFTEEILNRKFSFLCSERESLYDFEILSFKFLLLRKIFKEKLKQQIPKLNLKD